MKCIDCRFYNPASAKSYMRGGWCNIEFPFAFILHNDMRRVREYPKDMGCDLGQPDPPARSASSP